MKKKYYALASVFLVIIALAMTLAGPNLQGMLVRLTPASKIQVKQKMLPVIKPPPQIKKTYCNLKHIDAAFIILYQDDSQLTPESINKMTGIRNDFEVAFPIATDNLATITIDPEIYTQKVDKNLFIGDTNNFEDEYTTMGSIIKQFINTNGDNHDQIFIAYTWGGASSQYHSVIKNEILNIGMDNYVDHSQAYGTQKLKGYTLMPNLNVLVYPADGLYANKLLHELGHQWCCYAGDNFAGDNDPNKIEIKQDYIHLYFGIESPYENSTPMNAKKWVSNGDLTYHTDETLSNTQAVKKYHPITLYYMGLLPLSEYDTEFDIYNAGPDDPANMYEQFNFENAQFYKSITINDIIDALGERRCK